MCVVGEGEGREGEGDCVCLQNCMMTSGPYEGTVSNRGYGGMFIALVLSMVAYAVMSQWKKRLMLFSN